MNLGGIGSLAGGLAPFVQQASDDYAAGLGIYAMAGIPPPGQQPLGQLAVGQPQQGQQQGLGSLTSGLLNQPLSPASQPPQPGQGGVARSPTIPLSPGPSIQPAATTSMSVPPRSAPMTAQPGVNPPGQSAQASAPVGTTGTAALSQQQQTPPPQPQQQVAPQNLQRFSGMFDMPTLVGNLIKTPGMNPMKLGRIARSQGFRTMLNQEGLQQYRALNLMLGQERIGLGQERIDQGERRQKSLDQYRGGLANWRKQALGYGSSVRAVMQEARSKIAAINAAVGRGDLDQKEAQKQIDAINGDMDKKIEQASKGLSEPPQGEEQGANDTAPLDEAKAAIAAGAPRDKVIARFKQLHPELDASGL